MIVAILFNELVQGAAIVAITYLAVRCVSERYAATRHALWFSGLLALVFVPLLTIVSNVGARLVDVLRPSGGVHATTVWLIPAGTIAHDATQLAAPVASWIIAVWLIGAAVQGSRLVASLLRIERIRRNAAPLDICGECVLVSTDVTIPIAAGLLKPVVIIPKMVVETLAPNDLERVVAHERAHIRRKDILGNLIQRSIEAVLFFNPCVYIIGRNLINERESACDDVAVQQTGAVTDYAECLASLAQSVRRRQAPLLTPSALGSRNALVARIERLARNGASGATSLNYYPIGGTIVVFAILTLALQALSPASAAPTYTSPAFLSGGSVVAAAACTVPNADARVITPAPPAIPDSAAHLRGAVDIIVTIASTGHVSSAAVEHSSGNPKADAAVLKAAKTSTYSPARKDCKPVVGRYLFHATFKPNS
jgi:TonB family protein